MWRAGDRLPDKPEKSRVRLAERWKDVDFRFTNIDVLHVKILDMLAEDCRKKNVEIAKDLGISEPTVRKRIRQMEDMGLISGYSAMIDLGVVERSVRAYVMLKVEHEHRLKVIKKMCQHPRSIAVYGMAGENDILSVMLFTDAKEFRDFADEHQKMEGVKSVMMQVVITAYKGDVWSGA